MYGIRKKQSKYRDVINQDVVILDDIFSQLLVMNANEDGIIYDALMTYVKGDTPRWENVGMVDLITAELVVFDCNGKFNEKVKLDRLMEPVQKMIPLVLQKSGYFGHLDPSPWPYRRPINHPQNEKSGDCAVYAIKYIEFDMQGQNFETINDANIKFYREKMAINIYHNDWVP
ncbi:hypothetical protein TIFTF001_023844 [Ficus carica]|uniref:Ubiquitin-like protease family profile domain-containing protein n=1 Tax=Ficus carica TaxID=3494 RepID=A0AA88AP51_FICCA|nr:hypothetical protein TIFTF001_023844 [Ficus carica]